MHKLLIQQRDGGLVQFLLAVDQVHQQADDDAEADHEGEDMLAQHVSFEYSHVALCFNTIWSEPEPVPGVLFHV